ncbi:MAG: sugar phosphate isomerase/epimerase [Planctomycetaceae bacterium]|jgi:sugar phosphate isomerase/epimerase|nr:sugar phosphate isomerase/epimerase [Planctomycetaceae bacterium]
MNRRNFLKLSSLGAGTIAFANSLPLCSIFAKENLSQSKKADLKLTVQTWSFRLFDIDEGIRKTKQAGVKFVEIAGSIRIKGENKRAVAMTAEERKWFLAIAEENQVQAISVGGNKGTRQEFDFAAELGLTVMQGEPDFERLVEVSKLAEEYKIRFALHNHAKPNRYWNYKETLKRLDGCSPWLGFCPDTGHFARSGIDPLTVVKDLKGRIVSIHLKDLNDVNTQDGEKKDLHDVIWGTGKGQVEAIIHELVEQKVQAPIIIEYEYKWEDNVKEITECAKYFHNIVPDAAK